MPKAVNNEYLIDDLISPSPTGVSLNQDSDSDSARTMLINRVISGSEYRLESAC